MYLKEKNVDPNTQNYKTDLHKNVIFLIYKVHRNQWEESLKTNPKINKDKGKASYKIWNKYYQ